MWMRCLRTDIFTKVLYLFWSPSIYMYLFQLKVSHATCMLSFNVNHYIWVMWSHLKTSFYTGKVYLILYFLDTVPEWQRVTFDKQQLNRVLDVVSGNRTNHVERKDEEKIMLWLRGRWAKWLTFYTFWTFLRQLLSIAVFM